MFSRIAQKLKDGSDRRSSGKKEPKLIEIDGRDSILSVAFLEDSKYVVSGGTEGRIRRWRVEDGVEVGTPMDAGTIVNSLAVSGDAKWIVSGTGSRRVTFWNAENYLKAKEFNGHFSYVQATDVSLDTKRIATGSADGSMCVWSLPDGRRLLGPLKLAKNVIAVKVSPDGRLVAVAAWGPNSVQICDSQNGNCILNFPMHVGSSYNQSLAWTNDSKQLYALSSDGDINYLDASTGAILSKWRIRTSDIAKCIALACNGTFVATSAGSSVSFWDTTTRKRIGSLQHPAEVVSMAISKNYDIVISGGKKIILRNLCDVLPLSYFQDMFREQEIECLKAEKAKLDESLRAQECSSNDKIAHLEKTIQELHAQLTRSQRKSNQRVDTLNETIKSLGEKDESSNSKIAHLETTIEQLRTQLAEAQRKADEKDDLVKALYAAVRAHEEKPRCEALYAKGHIHDAAKSVLEIANAVNGVKLDMPIVDWVTEFSSRCVTSLQSAGDQELNRRRGDEALATYSLALSLGPSNPNALLTKWASTMLARVPASEVFHAATKFDLPRFLIQRSICDVLEIDGCIAEAVEYFRQISGELANDTSIRAERAAWELDFRARCAGRLEKLGDAALSSNKADEAVKSYSDVLSLDPSNAGEVLVKRSKAWAVLCKWQEALADAGKIIELQPSYYKGYERKHAALHGMERYKEAFVAFTEMLSKLKRSDDQHIRDLHFQFVDATTTIRGVIQETIRNLPRVLIDTTTGRLCNKKQQAAAFEELSVYDEMRSSMTTQLDYKRIFAEVKKYYRYVMLSHRWEVDEPLFQTVEHISIYELEVSPANLKLRTFCSIARDLGFQWVWSDTCCINKEDHKVLQESLVAMFTWYHGSSLTIVYLRGLCSRSMQPGNLRSSIWNTRAWTYQEYIAAGTVQFYTEDWKPYLGLEMFNHKDSSAIISEMEQVSGISATELALLRPGLDKVREKLYLASTRQTTEQEDMAYSLLGIFNASIPVIYGEGNRAVGRLLEHILTGSGDSTILAWTGCAGGYNSCLPANLAVYNEIVPPHISQLVETTDMERVVTELRLSSPDLSLVERLYDRLHLLPSPSLAANRLRLPCIVFPVTKLVRISESDPEAGPHVYRATTSTFGDVKIKTRDDLIGLNDLCLVHPWIRTLLDQEFLDGAVGLDKTTKALRLTARLRRPFGALLFAPVTRVEHKRVAADCLIMVQVREETSLTDVIEDVRTIEVH